jgi:hypothetical protein
MSVYKFYGELKRKEIQLFQEQNLIKYFGTSNVLIKCPEDVLLIHPIDKPLYFEIKHDNESDSPFSVKKLDVETVDTLYEAIRESIKDNDKLFSEVKEREYHRKKSAIDYNVIQDIIDRMYLYGEEFNTKLQEEMKQTFKKFPIIVEYVKGDPDDTGAEAFRKVSKPKQSNNLKP